MNTRWMVVVAVIVITWIIADEIVYYWWRSLNPGHKYSHVRKVTAGLVDPNMPPTVYEQENNATW